MKTTKLSQEHPFITQASPFNLAYRNDSPRVPVGPHSHDAAELYLTLSDLPDVILNDRVVEVPSGTLIIVPPFCVHQLYHRKDAVYERYVLNIQVKWLEDVFGNSDQTMFYLRKDAEPTLITLKNAQEKRIMKALDKQLGHRNACTPESLADFFSLLTEIDGVVNSVAPRKEALYRASETQRKVSEIIAYIHDNIYEGVTVSSLADHFNFNPDYISRLFKKHVHTSLGNYITLLKMSTAQNLLREGFSVREVQEKLGYSSYAYFFKTFKKNVGVSPSQYGK